jgi:16S rRNA (adenine1518-N6/adenine1519-N6)-dimethyltransferase
MADIEVVNEYDEVIDTVPYEEMVEKQLRHRIARVFLFDKDRKLYLQRRSMKMGVAPGLWDQSAAGHVDPGEDYEQAAYRELKEELGIQDIKLNLLVHYYAEEAHPSGKPMRRFQTIYVGEYGDQVIDLDPEEVMDGKWVSIPELESWISESPHEFTGAFIDAYKRYKEAM